MKLITNVGRAILPIVLLASCQPNPVATTQVQETPPTVASSPIATPSQSPSVVAVVEPEPSPQETRSPSPSPVVETPVEPPFEERAAVLTAREPGSRINLREQPSTEGEAAQYGLDGDRVTVIDETKGADGYTWYKVRFPASGAIGWIRGDFVADPSAVAARPAPQAAPAVASRGNCDPSYPSLCLPVGSPDLDCGDVPSRRFAVLPPDPHEFDGDGDGIGCES